MAEEHVVALGGDGAGGVEDVACNGLVVFAFGKVKVEFLVDGGDFASAGEFVCVFVDRAHHKACLVVLVLDVAEYFLHKVFEGYEACHAAEFVDNDGDGAFFVAQLDWLSLLLQSDNPKSSMNHSSSEMQRKVFVFW